jgi:hypothetical protein
MEAMKKCKDEISEASAATEVPWEVVWPLLLGEDAVHLQW